MAAVSNTASRTKPSAAGGSAPAQAASTAATQVRPKPGKPPHPGKPPPAPLYGWLGAGTTFPNRALVLTAPSGSPLTAASVHVSENGKPVTGLRLTPLSQAQSGDFGVMMVVDQNGSTTGAPMKAMMDAVRGFAAARTAKEALGLVTFDDTPNVLLRPTNDAKSVNTVLSATPWSGKGANVPAANRLALTELAQAKVALGAIIVISDGVATSGTTSRPAPAAVEAAAAAAHVPIFTVGLKDAAATPETFSALRAASPGQFVASTLAALPSTLQSISATLRRGYVLRYRSRQPAASSVSVIVTATGTQGAVRLGYHAPAIPAPAVSPRARRPAAEAHRRAQLLGDDPALPAAELRAGGAAPAGF